MHSSYTNINNKYAAENLHKYHIILAGQGSAYQGRQGFIKELLQTSTASYL